MKKIMLTTALAGIISTSLMADQINLEVPDFSKDYMDVKVGMGLHDSPYVGKDTQVISLGVEKTIHTAEIGNVDLVGDLLVGYENEYVKFDTGVEKELVSFQNGMFTLGGTVKGTMEREVENTETFIGGGVWAAVNVDTFQELKVGANILASSIDDVNYVKNVYAQMQGQITDNYKIGGGLDFKQPLPSQSS